MKGIFDSKWIASSFQLSTLLLIPVCVSINIVGKQINMMLGLPIYLDTIGTIFIGIVAGPWIGGIAGSLTNFVNSIIFGNPNTAAFFPVSMAVGITAGILSYKKMFLSPLKTSISAVIITLITLITSIPIAIYVFGGATGSNADFVTSLLLASGMRFMESVLSMQLVTNVVDKLLSIAVSYVLIKSVPKRFLAKQPLGFVYTDLETASNDDEWDKE